MEKAQPGGQNRLIQDIREVRRQLEAVQAFFALETDEDLLDAAIYQREALQARYRYLLRLARENNTVADSLPVERENRERRIN
ncbi:MAG: YaaL family protein [Firmicutes bacterium]|nr:YaaL family protein [Bacillota bacterium]